MIVSHVFDFFYRNLYACQCLLPKHYTFPMQRSMAFLDIRREKKQTQVLKCVFWTHSQVEKEKCVLGTLINCRHSPQSIFHLIAGPNLPLRNMVLCTGALVSNRHIGIVVHVFDSNMGTLQIQRGPVLLRLFFSELHSITQTHTHKTEFRPNLCTFFFLSFFLLISISYVCGVQKVRDLHHFDRDSTRHNKQNNEPEMNTATNDEIRKQRKKIETETGEMHISTKITVTAEIHIVLLEMYV